MFLQTELGCRDQAAGDGQQPCFAVAMPAAIDGNGFQAEVERGEMRCSGDAGLAQDGRRQQPAKPGRTLQDGQFIPGIQRKDGLQHRRQISYQGKRATPFLETRVLVPIEIIDQRIPFSDGGLSRAGRLGYLDRCLRSGEQRIDSGELGVERTGILLGCVFPLPSSAGRSIRRRNDTDWTIGTKVCCRPRLPEAVGAERPARRLRGDAPAGAQHVAGNGQLVGRGANVVAGVVQH
ncbi:hypothetical protein FQZ97_887320 [compost metagenome]